MVCVLLPKEVWIQVLAVTLLVLNSQVAAGRHSPEDFMIQAKYECHFENGTEHVRLVARGIYNREEYVRFDSDVGKFVAVTELGRRSAERDNSVKENLEKARAAVDTYCRHNYRVLEFFLVPRSGSQLAGEAAEGPGLSQGDIP